MNKKICFWTLIFFDRILSLRLGRGSTMQDFDISVDDPIDHLALKDPAWKVWLTTSLDIAKIHGFMYEKLYSPGSLHRSQQERVRTIDEICTKIHSVSVANTQALEVSSSHYDYMRILVASNDVILQCLLTLAHRAAPLSNNSAFIFSDACLSSARATIIAHERYVTEFKKGTALWTDYVNWSILICPFTPFMVIFCYVVMTLSLDDLALLERFASTLDAEFTEAPLQAIETFHELCKAFCTLARKYISARLQNGPAGQGIALASGNDMGGERGHGSLLHAYAPIARNTGSGMDESNPDWWLTSAFDDWLVGDSQTVDMLGGQKGAFGLGGL